MYFLVNEVFRQPNIEIIEQMDEIINALELEEGQKLSVGLLKEQAYEYPLWVELKKRPIMLKHVLLEQEPIEGYPMYIIAMGRENQYPDDLQYVQERYMCIWRYDDTGTFKVYMKR